MLPREDSALLKRGQCVTGARTVYYLGEDSVVLRRGQCGTQERTVHN